MANEAFDKFTDQPGDASLGGRRLQADRQELLAVVDRLVLFVNATVAHAQAGDEKPSVTYGQFDACIDHVGEMLKRYHLLIDQGALVSVAPEIQDDWLGPFRRPLLE